MPRFPDSSRVWITDKHGKPLDEYKEQVVEKPLKHTRSVYIAAEEGEFVVWYSMGQSKEPCRKLDVRVDGQFVQSFRIKQEIYGQPLKCEGWLLDSTTVKRFAFGAIDTMKEDDVGAGAARQPTTSCIEVLFIDAEMRAEEREQVPVLRNKPQIADAVHPDSKAAQIVRTQVKTGGTSELADALLYSKHRTVRKESATRYLARFNYRPREILEALGVIPAPLPSDTDLFADTQDVVAKTGKRKHCETTDPEVSVAALEIENDSVLKEQRRKRLMTDLLAMQREYGEDEILDVLLGSSKASVKAERSGSATVKDEHPSGQSTSSAIEPGHRATSLEGHSASRATHKKATTKHQTIFVDLSVESD